mgnify:CR=1 FL=1|tara:strand:+ start:148 stop:384 length:237 start_codon:yes stop_codon:yes gene_type:complete
MKDKTTIKFLLSMRDKDKDEWLSILENHVLAEVIAGGSIAVRNGFLETVHTWFYNDSMVKQFIELNEIIEKKAKEMEI